MPPRRSEPTTALGRAIAARRGSATLQEAAAELGLHLTTLGRYERGERTPDLASARSLARWLGWTLEQVAEAAAESTDAVPADPSCV